MLPKINAKIKLEKKTFQVWNIQRAYIIVSDYSQAWPAGPRSKEVSRFTSFLWRTVEWPKKGGKRGSHRELDPCPPSSCSRKFSSSAFVIVCLYAIFETEEEDERISSAVCILKPLKAGDNILLCAEKFLRIRNCSNFLQNLQNSCRLLFLLIVPGRDRLN